MPLRPHAEALERLYRRYNSREFVHPDPAEFIYNYEDPGDREIVAMIAASLAYGRVGHILRSVSAVLERMGPAPAEYVRSAGATRIERDFAGFRHRFHKTVHLADLLGGMAGALERHGSLEACFLAGLNRRDQTVSPALQAFVGELNRDVPARDRRLLPDPAGGSACKRLHLFLRWMVRRDAVDTGPWRSVPPAMLVVPLDTHMHRIGRALGATDRRAADLRTALEITAAFRAVRPDDPVRYDFALTRLGIRDDANAAEDFPPLATMEAKND